MKTDEAAVAAAVPMGRLCIAALDRLLGSRPFLAADQLTIADLMLAPQLDFFVATPEGKAMIDGTRLRMWLERMNRRPSMVATRRPQALRGAA
jgi:glutathione S-transferase